MPKLKATSNPKMIKIISRNIDKRREVWRQTLTNINETTDTTILCLQDFMNQNDEETKNEINNRTRKPITIIHSTSGNRTRKFSCATIIVGHNIKIKKQLVHEDQESMFLYTDIQSNEAELNLTNMYIRPRASYTSQEMMIKKLKDTIRDPDNSNSKKSIIAGDINGSALEWTPIENFVDEPYTQYSNIKKSRGARIEYLMQELKLTNALANQQQPTYIDTATNSKSYIDIMFIGERLVNKITKARIMQDDTHKGHTGIEINIEFNQNQKAKIKTHKRTNYKLIRAEHFKKLHQIDRNYTHNWMHLNEQKIEEIMNHLTTKLYETLQEVQKAITTKHKYRRSRNKIGLIVQQRRLQTKLENRQQHRGNLTTKKQLTKTIAQNKIRSKLHKTINKLLDNKNATIWENVKNYDHIMTREESNITIGTNTTPNIENLESIVKEKFPQLKNLNNRLMTSLNNISHKHININDQEIEQAIKECRKKTHFGIDGVRIKTLINSMEHIKQIVSTICRISFYLGKIPKMCQLTRGIIIPKKTAGKYRIVHVGSALTAILEAIATKRLSYILEKNNLIDAHQYGFVAKRSRHDLMARLIELGAKYKAQMGPKARTTIINIDIMGAFDNVDQGLLIEKILLELNTDEPNADMRKWLTNYILERYIRIEYNQIRTSIVKVCKGVPQGSALGPALWNFYINQTDSNLHQRGKTEILKYADDLMVVFNGNDALELQESLNKLISNLETLKLEVEPSKCTLMTINFLARLQVKETEMPMVTINNTPIPRITHTKHLGMEFDTNLRLHLGQEFKNKILTNASILHKWHNLGLIKSAKEWRIAYESMIESLIIQNHSVIVAIDKRAQKKLETMTARTIKIIFGWPTNASSKLARLLIHPKSIQLEALKQIEIKLSTEHWDSYKTILDIANNQQTDDETYELKDRALTRKCFNPNLMIGIKQLPAQDEPRLPSNKWMVFSRQTNDSTEATMGVGNIITRKTIIKHTMAKNSYAQALGALYTITTNKQNRDTNLIAHKNNSAIGALTNYSNQDHRVIEIRERMASNNWTIWLVERKETFLEIRTKIKHKIGFINASNDETIQISTNWPSLEDYIHRAGVRKRLDQAERTYAQVELMTSICKLISTNLNTWTRINIARLRTSSVLMLTGLTNENGTLAKSKHFTCNKCQLNTELIDQNEATHTIIRCQAVREPKTLMIRRRINKKSGHKEDHAPISGSQLIEATSDRRIVSELIKQMSKIAFE